MRAGSLGMLAVLAVQASTAFAAPALADTPAVDDASARGRAAFIRGQALAKDEQWGDALSAFEDAAAARDAPLVEFSIAYCERALGRYVAARKTLQAVATDPKGLDPSQIADMKAYLDEFDRLLVRVAVQLDPPTATLTIDGRPLAPVSSGGASGEKNDEYLGGVAAPAIGVPLGKSALTVLLDPGAHLVRAVREGHQDVVVLKSYRPGEQAKLDLHLDVLPATIAIKTEPPMGIVKVDAREVGVAPLEFQRPAGQYKLEVVLDHYDTYKAALDLAPGQRSDLTAHLNPYTVPLVKRWWFWTAAVVVVAGGATLTYFLARGTPAPPDYERGTTGTLFQGLTRQSLSW